MILRMLRKMTLKTHGPKHFVTAFLAGILSASMVAGGAIAAYAQEPGPTSSASAEPVDGATNSNSGSTNDGANTASDGIRSDADSGSSAVPPAPAADDTLVHDSGRLMAADGSKELTLEAPRVEDADKLHVESNGVTGLAGASPDIVVKDELTADEAYVSKLTIEDIVTGMAPFDKDDNRGNDSSADNMIIRSFDKATYTLKFVTTSDDEMTYFDKTRVGFKVTLPVDDQKAGFDMASISWADYTPGYEPKATVNDDGTQTLICYRVLEPTSEQPHTTPGTYSVPFGINIKAMVNGETFEPVFEAWTVPNDVHHRVARVKADPVTISSYPQFNAAVSDLQISGGAREWEFNAANGRGIYPSDDLYSGEKHKGILTMFVGTVSMVNKDRTKGMKGLEVPKPGENLKYTFDISAYFRKTGSNTNEPVEPDSQVMLWGAKGQEYTNTLRNELMPQNTNRIPWPIWQPRGDFSVASNRFSTSMSTYNSGNVEVEENRRADKSAYSINVHDWQVDVNKFPTRPNSGTATCGTRYSTSTCEIIEGAITTNVFYVLSPTTINGQDVEKYYNASLTQYNDIQIQSIDITSVTDVNVRQQTRTDDDKLSNGRHVSPGGKFSMHTKYNCSAMPWISAEYNGTDCGGWTAPDDKHGTDATIRGNRQRISLASWYANNGVDEQRPVMGINLAKIDTKALEVTRDLSLANPMNGVRAPKESVWKIYHSTSYNAPNGSTRVLYATKKDGTDWLSEDEQKKAGIDDLTYFDNYDDAIAHGIIVGVMVVNNSASPNAAVSSLYSPTFMVDVKSDAKVGHVSPLYQIAEMWTRGELIEHGINLPVTDYDAWNDWASKQDPLELRKTIEPNYWDASWDGKNRDYVKTSYDKNGVYIPGTEGERFGDSLTILGEKARTSVSTRQAKPDGTVGKNMYDIDKEQRIADWNIGVYANYSGTIGGAQTQPTTVNLKVSVPKGLTYIDGSSHFEGEYHEKTPLAGEFTGGTSVDPVKVTKNANGTTTLEYVFENFNLDMRYKPLTISTRIGDASNPDTDVKNGDQFTLTSEITSSGDMAKPSSQNGKQARYTIQVTRTKASTLATRAEPLIAEINDALDFVDMVANGSNANKDNSTFVGFMPVNGVAGSKYSGSWAFSGMEFSSSGIDVSEDNLDLYVTSDASYAGASPVEVMAADLSKFGKVPFNGSTPDFSGVKNLANTCVFVLKVKRMAPNSRMDIRLKATGKNNAYGDLYVNRLADGDNIVSALSTVVRREVNGVVWEDSNKNGERDDDEQLVKGVKVELVSPILSVVSRTVTDENGFYSFVGVAAGDYMLKFFAPDGTDWSRYVVTTKQVSGVDSSKNSDADSVSKDNLFRGATITLARMPDVANMATSRYVDAHEDMGIVRLHNQLATMPQAGATPWLLLLGIVSVLGTLFSVMLLLGATKDKKKQ